MFGIMCKAADLGFPVFVLLTTDNVVLQQQTLDRVKSDLEGFCICGENDARLFAGEQSYTAGNYRLKKECKSAEIMVKYIEFYWIYERKSAICH